MGLSLVAGFFVVVAAVMFAVKYRGELKAQFSGSHNWLPIMLLLLADVGSLA
ncbi:MAG: hypothetical protein QXP97_00130 [Desulfurococcus sp.]|uniref:hypothetical protein n=1 Tax=Desulfurococcus sp. TaxID=51678 RepID=UPI0031635E08